MLHAELTSKILKAYFTVYNTLGYGFLEKVYENAFSLELSKSGLFVEQQKNIKIFYDSKQIGDYFADIVVERCVLVELKSADYLHKEYEAQLLNYLSATSIEVGLLLNFGKEPEFRRKVYTNDRKPFSRSANNNQ